MTKRILYLVLVLTSFQLFAQLPNINIPIGGDVGRILNHPAESLGEGAKAAGKGVDHLAHEIGKGADHLGTEINKQAIEAGNAFSANSRALGEGIDHLGKEINKTGDNLGKAFCSVFTLGGSDRGEASCSINAGVGHDQNGYYTF